MTIDDTTGSLCALQAVLDSANEERRKLLSELRIFAYELNAANAAADVAEQKQAAAEAECERLRDQLGMMQTECNKAWKRAEQLDFELALLRGRE